MTTCKMIIEKEIETQINKKEAFINKNEQ